MKIVKIDLHLFSFGWLQKFEMIPTKLPISPLGGEYLILNATGSLQNVSQVTQLRAHAL